MRSPDVEEGPLAGSVTAEQLVGVRAALSAGAAPTSALAEAADGCLGPLVRAVSLGGSVAQEATSVDTGDPVADALVRALGVAERAGIGAGLAVAQSLHVLQDRIATERLIEVRTAQARMTARILSILPPAAWALLALVDTGTIGFYATPLGTLTGGVAVVFVLAGRWWSARIVARAERAGANADPLVPPRPRPDPLRGLAVAAPVAITVAWGVGLSVALVVGLVVGVVLSRPRPLSGPDTTSGGAAEAAELLAIALAAGLPTAAAVTAVADLAPPAARRPLVDAGRRLRGGWDAREAFAGTGLDGLGRTLATAARWGAPAADVVRDLAADLRAARRNAAEEAAERVQVALVFPTTLLTLPAFVLGVVPPLLWTALAGGVGLT